MTLWVALLRGVNVGGHRRLAMAELRGALAEDGFGSVRTYVQSGNVVLDAPDGLGEAGVAARVAATVVAVSGLEVPVVVRSAPEVLDVAARHPFAAAGVAPSLLHVAFLEREPDPAALASLDPDRCPPDRIVADGRQLYVHTPGGLGRSAVLTGLERTLRTPFTVRNMATVSALGAMCG